MGWALALLLLAPTCLAQERPKIAGLLNAASFSVDVAPGAIVSLFGTALSASTVQATTRPLPKLLAGVEVAACTAPVIPGKPSTPWTGCLATELIFVSPGQVNLILPVTAIAPPTAYRMALRVRRDGIDDAGTAASQQVIVDVQPAAPGIFRMGYDCAYPTACQITALSSTGHASLRGAIVDQAGTLVSSTNPVTPGKIYSLYYTGEGVVTFQYVGTAAHLTSIVSVAYDGGLHYKGPAPGFSGLTQMNFELPSSLRRALGDGENLPRCVDLTADIRTELRFVLENNISTGKLVSDEVSIPVFIRKEELDCKR